MAQIPTARGDTIEPKDLGFSLVSECIVGPSLAEVQNNWPEYTCAAVPDRDVVQKLIKAKENGVDTILDRVVPSLGRNVERVNRLAKQVPLNIIVCTGWYINVPRDSFPLFLFSWTLDSNKNFDRSDKKNPLGAVGPNDLVVYPEGEDVTNFFMKRVKDENWYQHRKWPTLEQVMLKDIGEGVRNTGVRAGYINITNREVFAGYKPAASARAELSSSAIEIIGICAKVHRKTGVFIAADTGIGIGAPRGARLQDVLKENGVDLSRVMLSRLDFTPPEVAIDDFVKLADRGSLLSFDAVRLAPMFPPNWAEKRIERIAELCKRGYAEHVLISHDDSVQRDDQPLLASKFPTYCEISMGLIPKLKESGVTDRQIEQITIRNPRRLFESNGKGAY